MSEFNRNPWSFITRLIVALFISSFAFVPAASIYIISCLQYNRYLQWLHECQIRCMQRNLDHQALANLLRPVSVYAIGHKDMLDCESNCRLKFNEDLLKVTVLNILIYCSHVGRLLTRSLWFSLGSPGREIME